MTQVVQAPGDKESDENRRGRDEERDVNEDRPRLNADWHRAHPMPKRATLDQRITWHLEHVEACGCRPAPASITRAIEERRASERPES
jgi:hypothetical protein